MILTLFTLFHVVISLIGIGSGFVVTCGLLTTRVQRNWTAVFLTTTVATSVTGYFFPVHHLMPSHVVGALSLLLLAAAIFALYKRRLSGAGRWIYVITAMMSLYLNVFVLIVQSFAKVPTLKAAAPTQSEPPFALAQGASLSVFVVLTVLAAIKFRPASPRPVLSGVAAAT